MTRAGCSRAGLGNADATPLRKRRRTAALQNRAAQAPAHQKQSGRSYDRPDSLETDFVTNYAERCFRSSRRVLMPNGRRSNAPAITVVGSGTTVTESLPEFSRIEYEPVIVNGAFAKM
jgi:peptide subunit release factor 1 (eRF1)